MGKVVLPQTPTPTPTPTPEISPTPTTDIKPTTTPGAVLTPIAASTPAPKLTSPIQTLTPTPVPEASPQINFTILIGIVAAIIVILGVLMITLRIRNSKKT
jgi:hypothetical protein